MTHLDAGSAMNKTFTLLGPDGKHYASLTPGIYGGHRAEWLCETPRFVRDALRVFADEATAIAAGYRPCAVCMSQEYAIWKMNQPARKPSSTHK